MRAVTGTGDGAAWGAWALVQAGSRTMLARAASPSRGGNILEGFGAACVNLGRMRGAPPNCITGTGARYVTTGRSPANRCQLPLRSDSSITPTHVSSSSSDV